MLLGSIICLSLNSGAVGEFGAQWEMGALPISEGGQQVPQQLTRTAGRPHQPGTHLNLGKGASHRGWYAECTAICSRRGTGIPQRQQSLVEAVA